MIAARTPMKFLAAFAVVAVAGAASATEFESNGHSTEVRYHDLDLSKKADQRRLNARIKRAAAKVCPASTRNEAAKCQTVAMAHVRAPIDAASARANGEGGEVYAVKSVDQPMGAAH
ncbi:MAG TPA: UrcA family protein [Sphingobium sp.]